MIPFLTAIMRYGCEEADKVQFLQFGNGKKFKGYGVIFQPTKEEQDAMLQLHADLLVEEISNQIS